MQSTTAIDDICKFSITNLRKFAVEKMLVVSEIVDRFCRGHQSRHAGYAVGMTTQQTSRVAIRPARPDDAVVLMDMIKGLAEYERLTDKFRTTAEDLQRWLLCDNAPAQTLIAEIDDQAVGYGVFFTTFSTFRGRPKMYLEDIFVRPSHRGKGIGEALLRHVAHIAAQRGCFRLEWSVLDWNEPAIAFYKSLGASPEAREWTIFGVSDEALAQLASK